MKMKRKLKRVVSIVLSVMMIISMASIGIITTNAANATIAQGTTIYFDNSVTSWSTVYFYGWNNSTDDNGYKQMDKIAGTDYWSYTLKGSYTGDFIFRGTNDNNNWTNTNATVNITNYDGSGNLAVPYAQNNARYGVNWSTYGTPTVTYYLGGRILQNGSSDWYTAKDYPFESTDTPGLYKYESKQTPKVWSETRSNLPQYFFVHTGSGRSSTWYGTNETTCLTSDSQVAELKTYTKDDDTIESRLTYINSTDTTDNVTFWLDTNDGMKLYYTSGASEPHNVTINGNIKVTANVDGVESVLNPDGDSETQNSINVEASTLTLTAGAVDYNFAGWKLGDGATIVSGSVSDKSITVKVTADTTITATAVTLTPRLSVNSSVAKNTTATVKQGEEFTLNALSKVGDKTQKAKKYTVDFYEYTSDVTNAQHIGEQIVINNVSYDRINSLVDEAGNKREPGDGEYLIGDEYKAVLTLSRQDAGAYHYYADIKGYDENGNLTTGESALPHLGTSFLKDEVTVTVVEPLDKAKAYDSGLWVDVQPSVEDSKIALIKWTNKSGANGNSGNTYTLYVPGGIKLNEMPIYSAFNTLKINNTTVPQGGTYNFTSGGSYSVDGNGNAYTLRVYQSQSDSMFTTTAVRYEADRSKAKEGDNLPTKSYGGTIDKVEYNGQFMSITAKDGAICDNIGIEKIKGRGNSSWEASGQLYGKYAYNVKFDSKIKPLNMKNATKAKSWCLLANNMDESGLRNAVAYETAMLAGLSNVPEYKEADLYNNGEYLGSYLITEKVDVGGSKLVDGETPEDHYDGSGDGNTHQATLSYNGSSIQYQYVDTGALKDGYTAKDLSYLIEFDLEERARAEHSWFKTPQGQYIAFKAPEDINKNEMEFVIKKWVDAEKAVYDNNYDKMNELMDLDSFADVYLVQEFTKNLDSCATSYYVYWNGFESESESAVKWEATPIWDYDWALGGYKNSKDLVSGGSEASAYPNDTSGWLAKYKCIVRSDTDVDRSKYNLQAKLANNTDFWNKNVVNAWNSDFYDSINAVFSEDGYIKQLYDETYASFDMNEIRYKYITSNLTGTWGSVDTGSNLSECYNYLLNWGHNRAVWMNERLGETVTVSLNTDSTEIQTGDSVTLTANLSRNKSTYPMTYQYYVSTDGADYTLLAETTDASLTTDALTAAGTYRYYVTATYSAYTKATSAVKTIEVKGESAKLTGVSLSTSSSAVAGTSINLAATPTTEGTVTGITYSYYRSDDNAVGNDILVKANTGATCSATAPNAEGTYYYYVTATFGETTVTSALVPVEVTEQQGTHTVTFKFKAPSINAYTPTITLDGTAYQMTCTDECLGSIYTGALKIYWYSVDISVDSTKNNTIRITSKATDLNAVYTDSFNGNEYYLAVDNLMSGTEVVDLTSQPEHIRNYYHVPTHMVYSEYYDDGSLGFTFVDGRRYRMGSYIVDGVATFSIDSVTAIQKLSADSIEVSELQTCLFDCNLDGVVDINDATLMQKALAQ